MRRIQKDSFRPLSATLRFFSLFLGLLVFSGSAVFAEVITMEPIPSVSFDEQKNSADIAIHLTNKGDEVARDVVIELPDFNISESAAEELGPQKSVDRKLSVPTDFLQEKSLPGLYVLLGRIRYKDLNAYPFSVPFPIEIQKQPLPAQLLLTRIESDNPADPIEISSSAKVTASVRNISTAEVELESIRPLLPAEIVGEVSLSAFPLKLAPSERRELTLRFENAGALAGSSFFVPVVFSGIGQGRHYAESMPLRLKIVSPILPPKLLILGGLILIAATTLIGWARKR